MGAEFHRAFSAGLLPSIKLLMLLNVYVGLFLLLPLPFFDGGHLVALVYRIAIRRRAKPTS
jgi:membrane-associated protease RseP (regulator of RpoE activity)